MNCHRTHGVLEAARSDGLGPVAEPRRPRPFTADPAVVLWGPELSGKGEGCAVPQATHVVLHRGQREETLSQMKPQRSNFRHKV